MVYDVTDVSTFESIRAWMQQIQTHAESGVSTILVGNKCDLEDSRVSVQFEVLFYSETYFSRERVLPVFVVAGGDVRSGRSPRQRVRNPLHGDLCGGVDQRGRGVQQAHADRVRSPGEHGHAVSQTQRVLQAAAGRQRWCQPETRQQRQ